MLASPRVLTPAGKSRFAPTCHTPLPPPHPPAVPSSPVIPPTGKVRVVARIRPFISSELAETGCISVRKGSAVYQEDTLHIQDPNTSREGSYKVDSCHVDEEDISIIFAREVEPLLPGLFQGCNATVFAYGATGSGKTYTMQGLEGRPGLMPLALKNILAMSENSDFQVTVSFYEIYMDRCYDLLEATGMEVKVLEGSDGRILLRGLSQVHVKTSEEFIELFLGGCMRRKFGRTGLNDTSSRSHGILSVTVTKDLNGSQTVGKLNLIDLAGNEDNRRTGNAGVRLAESAHINQSLFVLSNVISALNCREPWVPYRDSKLTRILQDSLGGKSRAVMVACLNPCSYHEAAHTLSLAARSRQIMNHSVNKKTDPTISVDMEAKLRAWLESRGKVSPSLRKPTFYTPSRPHVNHIRQLSKEFSATFTPRRVPVSNHAENVVQEPASEHKLCVLEKSTNQASLKHSDAKVSRDQGICNPESRAESKEASNLQLPVLKVEHPYPSGKKNYTDGGLPFTPDAKVISKSSSPPLSERLQSLRTAMKDILQPRSSNVLGIGANITHGPPSTCPNSKQLRFSPEPVSPVKTPTSICNKVESMRESETASPAKSPTSAANKVESVRYTGTPLEKFNKMGSGIKNSMVKEYLKFLNTASREELLELRGIGDKRAASILELRRDCCEPFKELEDLERIAISKKQAVSLFSGTARQILFADKVHH